MNLQPSHLFFLAGSVIYLGIRWTYQFRVRGADKRVDQSTPVDRLLIWLVILAQGLLPLVLCFTPVLDGARYERSAAMTLTGFMLMPLGLFLFWRSHADLGRQWSVTLELAERHRLVTHGVYRQIRHPMYAAFFLLAVSQVMLLDNFVAGPAALFAVSLLYWLRVPMEERMMAEAFGPEYELWRARTGALLPRFGRIRSD